MLWSMAAPLIFAKYQWRKPAHSFPDSFECIPFGRGNRPGRLHGTLRIEETKTGNGLLRVIIIQEITFSARSHQHRHGHLHAILQTHALQPLLCPERTPITDKDKLHVRVLFCQDSEFEQFRYFHPAVSADGRNKEKSNGMSDIGIQANGLPGQCSGFKLWRRRADDQFRTLHRYLERAGLLCRSYPAHNPQGQDEIAQDNDPESSQAEIEQHLHWN